MNFKELVKSLTPAVVQDVFKRQRVKESIKQFRFNPNQPSDVQVDIQEKYNHESELLNLFVTNQGPIVHKWHHYIPLYDRYFSRFRGKKTRFLEIGVSRGGSLQMWRKYFGADAIIFGIDIDPDCEKLDGLAGQVRIGSQIDAHFLDSVINEMGGVDIVLDDGSHEMNHITTTLQQLFPHLKQGGIYMIEDLHTAYWKKYGGGYGAKTNFFKFVMDLVDDMHCWYHQKGSKHQAISSACPGIHIHDSIVVLEKNEVYQPVHSRIGLTE